MNFKLPYLLNYLNCPFQMDDLENILKIMFLLLHYPPSCSPPLIHFSPLQVHQFEVPSTTIITIIFQLPLLFIKIFWFYLPPIFLWVNSVVLKVMWFCVMWDLWKTSFWFGFLFSINNSPKAYKGAFLVLIV